MNLRQKLMRFLAPACEKQRMQFRREMDKVLAHSEDLTRTVRLTPQQVAQIRERARG